MACDTSQRKVHTWLPEKKVATSCWSMPSIVPKSQLKTAVGQLDESRWGRRADAETFQLAEGSAARSERSIGGVGRFQLA